MKATIALLPGDGIGPEVCAQAVRVLDALSAVRGHRFEIETELVGGAAIDATGDPLPAATVALCERADAVLLAPSAARSGRIRTRRCVPNKVC